MIMSLLKVTSMLYLKYIAKFNSLLRASGKRTGNRKTLTKTIGPKLELNYFLSRSLFIQNRWFLSSSLGRLSFIIAGVAQT